MQESNEREPSRGNNSESDAATADEATSKDTLKDVEESEKSSDSTSGGDSGESDLPSPDGMGEELRDQPDDAGPM